MIIYVDLIFFVNFIYDLFLLLTVKVVLKRGGKLYRYLLSAFLGAIFVFTLFTSIPKVIFFFLKILVSIFMCQIAYGYKSLSYSISNIIYLYMTSTILAGFLNLLNISFTKASRVLLIIIAPSALVLYIYSSKKMKSTYNYYYRIEIVFDDVHINCLAFLDSGNKLIEPCTGKPVIIINKRFLKDVYNIRDPIYLVYNTVSSKGMMKCYKPSYIILNQKKIYNYLVGEASYKLSSGVDCLLNYKLMEDNYV